MGLKNSQKKRKPWETKVQALCDFLTAWEGYETH